MKLAAVSSLPACANMTAELTHAETATAARGEAPGQAYVLEGTLLEACDQLPTS